MINFNLMILAAGYGKRMENLTKNIPKPLLKINNTTLLSNTINFFYNLGCNQFVINTHYLHNQINNYININHSNKNITISFEPEILNTGGGIKKAINYFNNKNIVITNSDIFWDQNNRKDVINFINKFHNIKNCSLLLSKKENAIGINKNDGDFIIKDNYLKRWKKNYPIFFYSGLQIVNSEIFKNFPDTKFSINKIWDKLIENNKLEGNLMDSKLMHIGDKKTYSTYI